jgi:23S rRNA (adenine2503-C2)-methyltransferase
MPVDIRSRTEEELKAGFQAWAQPAYRVGQVLEWLYVHRVTSWDKMTNLPKSLREKLRQQYTLNTLQLVRKQGARDSTQKFLWRLPDGSLIESVLIPANPALYGEPSDRHTLCISTQVGCAYGCRFCASGLDGLKRNLDVEEIVEQVLAVERWNQSSDLGVGNPESKSDSSLQPGTVPALVTGRAAEPTRLVSNLVIMGMGEPLANYDNLLKALRILNAPWGCGIGARKITISTSGLVPQIRKLAEEPLQFRLAISLHGATDDTRNKIMPVNRRYPLRELAAACEYYQSRNGRMITFEYILIRGVNEDASQVKPLAALARRLNSKVNLIPYNTVEGLPWERPDEETQEHFLKALEREKVTATLRREKGHDIDAACGQLRLRTEKVERDIVGVDHGRQGRL